MRITHWLKPAMIVNVFVIFASAAHAEDLDIGKADFQSSCASCHGADGKGKGPVSDQLKVLFVVLLCLVLYYNGVFPVTAVYEIIDGCKTVSAHGTREMPIWGQRFNPVMNVPHIVDPTY